MSQEDKLERKAIEPTVKRAFTLPRKAVEAIIPRAPRVALAAAVVTGGLSLYELFKAPPAFADNVSCPVILQVGNDPSTLSALADLERSNGHSVINIIDPYAQNRPVIAQMRFPEEQRLAFDYHPNYQLFGQPAYYLEGDREGYWPQIYQNICKIPTYIGLTERVIQPTIIPTLTPYPPLPPTAIPYPTQPPPPTYTATAVPTPTLRVIPVPVEASNGPRIEEVDKYVSWWEILPIPIAIIIAGLLSGNLRPPVIVNRQPTETIVTPPGNRPPATVVTEQPVMPRPPAPTQVRVENPPRQPAAAAPATVRVENVPPVRTAPPVAPQQEVIPPAPRPRGVTPTTETRTQATPPVSRIIHEGTVHHDHRWVGGPGVVNVQGNVGMGGEMKVVGNVPVTGEITHRRFAERGQRTQGNVQQETVTTEERGSRTVRSVPVEAEVVENWPGERTEIRPTTTGGEQIVREQDVEIHREETEEQ